MRWLRPFHLQTLRDTRLLRGIVLAWFVLSLGAAIASPLVNPQAMELICSANGVMKLLVKNADGNSQGAEAGLASTMLDCPLCVATSAPPPVAKTTAEPAQPLGHVLQTIPAALHATRTAAPLSARGPPDFS